MTFICDTKIDLMRFFASFVNFLDLIIRSLFFKMYPQLFEEANSGNI